MANSNPWLQVRAGANIEGVRLLCAGHAGAGASAFRRWTALTPLLADLRILQLPGRESRWREPEITDFASLVDQIELGLADYHAMPYVLFGVSMGGLICYELARRAQLLDRRPPAELIIASCPPPHHVDHRLLRRLDDAALVEFIQQTSTSAVMLQEQPDLLAMVLRVLRADLQVCASFVFDASTVLSCPIVVLRGATDQTVSASQPDGWRERTLGRFESHTLPGGHLFMFEDGAEPALAWLAARLSRLSAPTWRSSVTLCQP